MSTASSNSIPPLFLPLKKIIEGDIDCTKDTLEKVSGDASYISITPQVVIYPKTKQDITHILTFIKTTRLPMTVRGRGTGSSGGALTEGVLIDMSKYFTMIDRVDIKNSTATIGAGAQIEKVCTRLEQLGVMCPVFGYDVLQRSIGGLVAENVSGSTSVTCGDTRLWVHGIAIILDDGREYHINEHTILEGRLLDIYRELSTTLLPYSKNIHASDNKRSNSTTGYNLWNQAIGPRQLIDLLVGSEGTLGIIVSVTFRIVPLQKHTFSLLVGADSHNDILQITSLYGQSDATSLSIFDMTLANIASISDKAKIPAYVKGLASKYVLTGTFVHRDEAGSLAKAEKCKKFLEQKNYITYIDAKNTWTKEQHTLRRNILHTYGEGRLACITTLDSIALPEDSYQLCAEQIENYISEKGYTYVIGGNLGAHQLSYIFLLDISSQKRKDGLEEVLTACASYVEKSAGSITGGNGDGIIRTPYMAISSDNTIRQLFKKIQYIFDREQVFNSGKKTFLTNPYLSYHMRNPH